MSCLLPLLFAASMAQAQPSPHSDFSGLWMLDVARSETLRANGSIERGPVAITQSGDSFQISWATDTRRETVTSEPQNASAPPEGSGKAMKAYWAGPAMVTETYATINGRSVTVTRSRTLAPGGAEMVVDTTIAIHHGYAPGEPLPQARARDIYVRAVHQ